MSEFIYHFAISFALLTPPFALIAFLGLLEIPRRFRIKYTIWIALAAGTVGGLFVTLLTLLP